MTTAHAPGSTPERRTLVRWELDAAITKQFFPALGMANYLPVEGSWYAYRPNLRIKRHWKEHPEGIFYQSTNGQGMRDDEDIRVDTPGVRVIFTGDSHIDGVVNNDESLPNVLESWLAKVLGAEEIEVINAAIGGYTLYNYLGTFERLVHLEPDVFVAVVYGGNDFQSTVTMYRYFGSLGSFQYKTIPRGPRADAWDRSGDIRSQESGQVEYFVNNPTDEALAIEGAVAVLCELDRLCAERSTELLVVYLPPPMAGQPAHWTEAIELTRIALDCDLEAVHVSDRIADGMLAGLRALDVPTVDLRPHIAASPKPLYWRADCHLDVAGHRECAALVSDALLALLPVSDGQRERLRATAIGDGARLPGPAETTPPAEAPYPGELTPPPAPNAHWRYSDPDIRFIALEGRPVVLLPAVGRPLAVEVDAPELYATASGVRIAMRTDGDFEARVHVGDRVSEVVQGSNTAREPRDFEFALPPANSTSAPTVLRVELLRCTTPVLVERLRPLL